MKVTLQKGGLEKTLKIGFSWSYFFLGAWLPLFKGQIGKSFKHSFLGIITLSFYYWLQAFKGWNRDIIISYIEKGYEPLNSTEEEKIRTL